MVDKVKQGKKNRISGSDFELRVRKDMTEKGWVVDKFGNNVELSEKGAVVAPDKPETPKNSISSAVRSGKLIQSKNKWAGPNRPMMMGAGFPDFICFKRSKSIATYELGLYKVVGVECKCNGYLTQLEKEKCRWLLDNNIFSKILIAEKTKVKNRVVIVYHDFEEKYGKKKIQT